MAIYIPSALKSEHEAARLSCPEYNKFCSNFDGPSMVAVDPASLDGSYQDETEPFTSNDMYIAIGALPEGRIRKLLKMYFSSFMLDHDYIRSVMNDANEENIIRLYAACSMMGGNDTVPEQDIKSKSTWAIDENESAQVCDKFMDLYSQANDEAKNDDLIMIEHMVCYCHKKRWEWYPLGDVKILDDICAFVRKFDSEHPSDLVKLRCDRELHIMAAWYRWAGQHDKSNAISNEIINRPTYMYSNNLYKISARTDLALSLMEHEDYLNAAKQLKNNIDDYGFMKSSGDFKSLNTHSFYENGLFLVQMLKVYDLLEALTGKSSEADVSLLVRSRPGSTTEDKVKALDIHDYRHQWINFCTNLKGRMKYKGYIDYISL